MGNEIVIDWEPQPRQLVALKACGLDSPFTGEPLKPAIADVIGYGGAAGGGKSDTLLAVGLVACIAYPGIQIAYFRREYPDLSGLGGAIDRSQKLYPEAICSYNKTDHRWTFKNGSLLQFNHCQHPGDELGYKSQQFDILLIDEMTEFLGEQVDFLITRNRATIDYPTFKPFASLATNPGDVGHTWFKERFVEGCQPETLHDYRTETGEIETHYFVPAKLSDNQILEKRDPSYRRKLSRTEMQRKVYLEGDWDVFKGQAFSELRRSVHVITPFEIPKHWMKFAAYDHGYNHNFSFGVYRVDDDGVVYKTNQAKDRLLRVDQIAKIMDEVSGGIETLEYIVAGHDCWTTKDGNPTIAEQYRTLVENKLYHKDVYLRQANIDRIQGANKVRMFLAWKGLIKNQDGTTADGKPQFYFFENCTSSYDCFARMVFDQVRPEDVLKVDADENGKGGDDEYDETRYALMSRPAPAILPSKQVKPNSGQSILEEIQNRNSLINSLKSWR